MTTETPRPAKRAAAPPTLEQLQAALAETERSLIEAKRTNATARSALAQHLTGGDAEVIAECRQEIKRSAADVRELSDTLEAQQEAVQAVEQRERAAASTRACREIEKLIGDARGDVDALADALTAFANALKEAVTAVNSVDALMLRAGIQPDPYLLRAKLIGMVELGLHLETEGVIGRSRTLENFHELRQAGRADLKLAAAEYQTLAVQRVRGALRATHSRE